MNVAPLAVADMAVDMLTFSTALDDYYIGMVLMMFQCVPSHEIHMQLSRSKSC
jgi:hypothetical protein